MKKRENPSERPSARKNRKQSPILEVQGLRTWFHLDGQIVKAVDGLDLCILRGEIFALIGESGSGKTVTALSLLRLITPPGRTDADRMLYDGVNLLDLDETQMQAVRTEKIAMIFQQAKTSLNPVFTVGNQMVEAIQLKRRNDRDAALQEAVALLDRMGLPDPEELAQAFPHELSGGQAQRVGIALAITGSPGLLIADEPTGALDVTIQAQILDLLREIQQRTGTAILLITHDPGVMAELADRAAVIYAGQIVEQTDVDTLFSTPLHPYTVGLMAAITSMPRKGEHLETIPGTAPNPADLPPACRFAPRCQARLDYGLEICQLHAPALRPVVDDRLVRCWLYHGHGRHRPPLSEPQSGSIGAGVQGAVSQA
ncbi:MAG TPA: ABC transporter ATP-binding protein [Anaerolineae bacterium]|nr:ABC transporter ATP-binding protein [Anaerolineae bacterium]